jgi:lipoate synthase
MLRRRISFLYLQPSQHHLPVLRFVTPERFAQFEQEALAMGFKHAACGPMMRSSYHAIQNKVVNPTRLYSRS